MGGSTTPGSAGTRWIRVPLGATNSVSPSPNAAGSAHSRRRLPACPVSPGSSRTVSPCPDSTATDGLSAGKMASTRNPRRCVKKLMVGDRSAQGSTT